MEFYGEVSKVLAMTKVKPEDFELEDQKENEEVIKTAEKQLEELIEDWLVAAKSYIDADRRRDFEEETPAGIHNIAERIATNIVSLNLARGQSPIIQAEDISVRLIEDKVLTPSIREDLAMFATGPTIEKRFFVGISNRKTREADYEE